MLIGHQWITLSLTIFYTKYFTMTKIFNFFVGLSFSLLIYSNSTDTSAYEIFDPRALAMGGASVAAGRFLAPLSNPAQLALVDERHDIFIDLPIIKQTNNYASDFAANLETYQQFASSQATRQDNALPTTDLQKRFQALTHQVDTTQLQISGLASLANTPVSLAIFANGHYTETLTAINHRRNNTQISQGVISLKAAAIIESGTMFAKVFQQTIGGNNRLSIGISPKLMAIRTYYYAAPAESINLSSQVKNITDATMLNIDMGIIKEFNYIWKTGLVVRNLLAKEIIYDGIAAGTFAVQPQARIGLAYRTARILIAADLDLTLNRALGYEEKTRFFSTGLEYALTPSLFLRTGLMKNLLNGGSGSLALGAGVKINVFVMDVALSINQQAYTLMAKTGLRF